MTAKEWLNRAKDIDKEIKELEQTQRNLFDELTKCTVPTDNERVDGGKSVTEDTKAKYLDLIDTIEFRKNILVTVKAEIIEAINDVEDSTLRIILMERYINNKKWFQIAQAVNYSERHVRTMLHSKALNLIEFYIKK